MTCGKYYKFERDVVSSCPTVASYPGLGTRLAQHVMVGVAYGFSMAMITPERESNTCMGFNTSNTFVHHDSVS